MSIPADSSSDIPRPSIHELPPELLCDIFAAIDDYVDLVASTHVCKHWRTLSLASPARLWADVASVYGIPGILEQTMARTQQAPARVNVVVHSSNAEEVARVLKEHLCHITSLSIQTEEEIEIELAEALSLALSIPAPLLDKLVILDLHQVFETGFHGKLDPLFGGQAPPGLITVKLCCPARLFAGIPAFSNVRGVLFAPSEGPFTLSELHDVLRLAPFDNLELLALEISDWDSIPASTEKIPQRLKGLSISMEDPSSSPADFLRSLDDHRHIASIRVVYGDEGCETELVAEVLEFVLPSAGRVVEMTIDSSSAGLAIIEAATETGFLREVSDVPPMLSETAFQHVTRLSINEWEWIAIDPMPSAPVLTHLTVRLVAPAYMEPESTHRSVFVDLDSGGVLHAPRLHTFAVSTRRRGDPALLGTSPTLAPETLSQFLANRVAYDHKPLPVLFLNGVRLLENLVDQVIRLLELVKDVQCGPGHYHAQAELDDVVSWE